MSRLFDWYEQGGIEGWPGNDMVSHVTPPSADYLRRTIEETGAIVLGRRVYDYTDGWGDNHPLDVPLFLMTHCRPQAWLPADAPFTDCH